MRKFFEQLLAAGTENEVQAILDAQGLSGDNDRWRPYGDNEAFYGVVENQQAHPVPALVEKVMNGIDAILEKKVVEHGIDIRSEHAPNSVQDALDRYFPNHKNWDIGDARRQQARDLQIVASGPRRDTSLLIYDNGVGQAPEDFPNTFLSLLRGNKNDVHFVQGKYNMGGAGAIAFCGDLRYQLVASKRFDGSRPLGFTLLRRHPPKLAAAANRKNTWYEYLVFDGKVASLDIDEMDIGLDGCRFSTGSLLKLYSYRSPEGARSIISRDLNVSLNEYLFEPALPFLTVDNNDRYPDNRAPVTAVYGLKRRLEGDKDSIEARFSETSTTAEFGQMKITTYVFKALSRETVKETKQYIQREYFKNNMTVLFSLNGQVQGSYSSEFVTRGLKMPLLKDYLLVHVDCTNLHLEVRNELFMASRDRLKASDTAEALRKHLREILSTGELKDIAKRRKASLTVGSEDAGQMLRDMTRNLPMNDALTRILQQTFQLSTPRPGEAPRIDRDNEDRPKREPRETIPFDPKRYPSTFQVKGGDGKQNDIKLFKLPMGGSRTISFATDVENEYFDRSDDPGILRLAVLQQGTSDRTGGPLSPPSQQGDLLDLRRSNPSEGTIKIGLRASREMKVGDTVEVRASLSSPSGDLVETVLVQLTDPERKVVEQKPEPAPPLGIPDLILCSRDGANNTKSWDDIQAAGVEMSFDVVVYPFVDEDKLSRIYINLDSSVLRDFKSGNRSPDAIELAERRYVSTVYFHTLFLFATTKSRKYSLKRGEDTEAVEDIEIADYIADLFTASYAQFLLSFDTADLVDVIG